MSAKFWTNVGVAIQSAIAAAQNMASPFITNASPGVATITGHGYNDGDYLLLAAQGMYQVDGLVIRVDNKTADTFELEGVDTTNYGTASGGSARKLTFGTTLATATNVSASGGDPEFADITTIHDSTRKQVPVLTSPFTLSFESIFDPSDAALVALKAAADNLSQRAVRVTFADGSKVVFNGYVSAPLIPTGQAGQVVKTNITITSASRPTVYAT